MEAQELKNQLSQELLDQEGVSGVGIGEDEDGNEVVVVNVEKGMASSFTVPEQYEGENVEVRETGPFHAEVVRQEPQATDRKAKHRPVPGGVSAGHVDITAGTTGYILEDGNGNQYASSNNHVYADVNSGSSGDTIVQPGPTDGGTASNDKSGELAGYVPIEDGAVLDLAWITQTSEHQLEIAGLGKPQGSPVSVSVGDTLIKAGRTTGITEGQVDQTSVDINVGYGDATYQINDCIITGDMSDGGDSGSAVLKKDTMEPAGILFAGSDSATAMNKATNIEPETSLTVVTAGQDDTTSVTVNLTLEQEGSDTGNMTVKAEDTGGSALGSVSITISGTSDASGVTDSTGVVSFTGIPIGSYTVEGTKDGYTGDSASVSESDWS